ncbi:MAG: Rne/Rng family ribonuclease [Deltaproteobacteria bacterium]|nr:Rne/Rng family ribonuclease [Deltaproteobacteria bacterium]MBW2069759.1 Rne/Rng family ribonuclease [Deltaproteobacteria bacterium]
MSTDLIINTTSYETRVALLENSTVSELYIERAGERSIAGNIYKGRVVRVLPGMQAAFVDIGLDKAAFLYVSDVSDNLDGMEEMMAAATEELDEEELECEQPLEFEAHIEDRLQEGQEILVQVAKEPLGSKGARITSHISLPGRHLVLMPTVDHVGVSRRIENDKERRRLRDLLLSIKPPTCGFIARTASEGVERDKIKTEMDFLLKLWNSIQRKNDHCQVPALLHQDLDVSLRAVRDLFTKEVDKLIVDSPEEYNKILKFVDTFMPSLKADVRLYEESEPIFDAYGIEVELQRALGKKVWLKSGGYIIIEITEALTAIDVNTGRYVGKRNLEETILKTNLEAVKEIAYQLRLRNIGGIIIIDFIDMAKESNRDKVFNSLKEALRKDKSKTNILKMSELGLIEMTRKRTKESITRVLCEPCFYCEGEGCLKSKTTICYEIFREIEREHETLFGRSIMVTAHPEVAHLLYDEERQHLEELERKLQGRITVQTDNHLHLEQYEISAVS